MPPRPFHSQASSPEADYESRFWAFVTASSDAVYIMNADWSEMRRLTGNHFIADLEAPTRDWQERYVFKDDWPLVRAEIERAVRTRTPFTLEHRVVCADRDVGWTFSRAVPLIDDHGEIQEWFGVATDITPRKKAEEAVVVLRTAADRQRRLYETVLSSTPDFVYVFDLQHRFVYANPALVRIWGCAADQAMGRTPREMGMPADDAREFDHAIEEAIRTEKTVRGDVPYEGTNGRRRYDYILAPVIGANGEPEAVAGISRDITELHEAQETAAQRHVELERIVSERTATLQAALSQMEDFSYAVSHDLRGPTQTICRYAAVLLEDDDHKLDAEARRIVGRIRHNSERLDKLTEDLLNYCTLDRREIQLERVSLAEIIDEVIRESPGLQPECATVELGSRFPDVVGHPESLVTVVENLLENAVKFVRPGQRPYVRIWAEPRDGNVRVWFEDNGIGVAEAAQPRLFGMFSKLHGTRDYAGNGIGLAIVRKAIDRMHGTVGMQSDGTNGCQFWVELPAAVPAEPNDG